MTHARLRLSCRLLVQSFVIVMLTFRDRWQSAKHMFSHEYSKHRSDYFMTEYANVLFTQM